ncbi:hypothetical protein [Nonlabens spongiae]|uniref:hypothetical protein n=1 Tax=Nonlabens spongiae TaxID=331648 RepID=UPI001B80E803|nr:hypothetical protein [Nonlabens spongiae]
MNTHYHILNGDALKEQFPKTIPGKIIVGRECLVDGPVQGDSLSAFLSSGRHSLARIMQILLSRIIWKTLFQNS